MRPLFLIPARGGSKRLRGKNLRCVHGMTLVARAVRTANQCLARCGLTDAVVLVDTDDEKIAEEGRRWGAAVPFLRPADLARDETLTIDTALHAVDRAQDLWGTFGAVVLLQPTSPLRTAEDIERCWQVFHPDRSPSVVSVSRAEGPTVRVVLGANGLITRGMEAEADDEIRKDGSFHCILNGAVYIASVAWLRAHRHFTVVGETRGVMMPAERSIDVDTVEDLKLARLLDITEVEPLSVASRTIGAGSPCFIIAEAGVNHNGDLALAHQLVDAAAEAGVDAIKFQTFDPDRLVTRTAPQADYQRVNTGRDESQHQMLQRLVLPGTAYDELRGHAKECGLTFLSTPFDTLSADFLERLGIEAFKVPSGELTNHPFLAHIARKGRPLLISTGMSRLDEVAAALHVVQKHGGPPVALLHCVSSYPSAPAECNLQAIQTMTATFGVPVGWSDHTVGINISCAAVALGARILEKHFTIDRGLPGPDHGASLEPDELQSLVEAVRTIESSLGDGVKRPTPGELAVAKVARRSLHAARELPPGHVLRSEDMVALRPEGGIPPSRYQDVVGRVMRARLIPGQIITEADLV